MVAEKVAGERPRQNLRIDDPLVVGVGARLLGLAIGSGRWGWIGRGAMRIAESIGTLTLSYFSQSLQQAHPEIFGERSRVFH